MNIYLHEFKASIRSIVTWSISLVLLILLFMSISGAFLEDTALITQAMAKFPEQLLVAFGMNNMDFASAIGFFGLVFLFCQICLGLQAANYGFALVSIEEAELTADFLLAKPIRRTTILTNKLLAALTGLAITELVVWISTFAALSIFGDGQEIDAQPLVALLLTMIPFQLFFLSVGLVISLLVKRVRSVTPFSMGLVFGLYILNAFGNMIGSDSLEVLSPFKHFEPNYIIKNTAYDLPVALISIAVIVISLGASYVLYPKRNIAAPV